MKIIYFGDVLVKSSGEKARAFICRDSSNKLRVFDTINNEYEIESIELPACIKG